MVGRFDSLLLWRPYLSAIGNITCSYVDFQRVDNIIMDVNTQLSIISMNIKYRYFMSWYRTFSTHVRLRLPVDFLHSSSLRKLDFKKCNTHWKCPLNHHNCSDFKTLLTQLCREFKKISFNFQRSLAYVTAIYIGVCMVKATVKVFFYVPTLRPIL